MLEYIYQQLKIREHLVIVVAEGAGDAVLDGDAEELKNMDKATDESGNKRLAVNK